jgi:putative ABC transport system permease protein
VLLFTLLISVGTGVLFGIAPALQLSGMQLTDALKESSRGAGHSVRQNRLRTLLVVAEMSLAMILLTGSGLLIRSLTHLEHVNPGFNPQGLITWSIDLPDSRYSKRGQPEAFFRALFERVRAIPGVRSASGVVPLPLSDEVVRTSYQVEGRRYAKGESPRVHFRTVALDYFRTMEIPLLKGRDFTPLDIRGANNVVIVNQALVDRSFPGEDPIGRRIQPGVGEDGKEPWRQIVGVVGNVKHRRLNLPDDPECYAPEEQVGWGSLSGVVRSDLPGGNLIPTIREQVRAIDKDLPIYRVRTMDEYVSRSVSLPRLDSTLLGIFAALALALAAVGVYGVMSYGVAQRTNEMGIRMSLGAQQGDVLRLVLRQGLVVALVGVGLGLVGALGAMRLLASLLFGVSPSDPVTFGCVACILMLCAVAACYIPAWRASHVDPMVALRYE